MKDEDDDDMLEKLYDHGLDLPYLETIITQLFSIPNCREITIESTISTPFNQSHHSSMIAMVHSYYLVMYLDLPSLNSMILDVGSFAGDGSPNRRTISQPPYNFKNTLKMICTLI